MASELSELIEKEREIFEKADSKRTKTMGIILLSFWTVGLVLGFLTTGGGLFERFSGAIGVSFAFVFIGILLGVAIGSSF